jgi:triosephosphate isomerase
MERERIVVGVWKDRLTPVESREAAEALVQEFPSGSLAYTGGIAPAVISALPVRDVLEDSALVTVAQDVHWPADSGSYIGTTSLAMLTESKIGYCMVGHSERRRFFHETNEEVASKLKGCLGTGIKPILCIGDSETDRDARIAVLSDQIRGSLGVPELTSRVEEIIVAYEPVWAISTWRSEQSLPTGSEVAEMLALVRELLQQNTETDPGKISVLFGGSVAPENADDYFAQPDVDGALVGGASLKPDSMAAVFRAGQNAWGGG